LSGIVSAIFAILGLGGSGDETGGGTAVVVELS
jgi:hypothetical protein